MMLLSVRVSGARRAPSRSPDSTKPYRPDCTSVLVVVLAAGGRLGGVVPVPSDLVSRLAARRTVGTPVACVLTSSKERILSVGVRVSCSTSCWLSESVSSRLYEPVMLLSVRVNVLVDVRSRSRMTRRRLPLIGLPLYWSSCSLPVAVSAGRPGSRVISFPVSLLVVLSVTDVSVRAHQERSVLRVRARFPFDARAAFGIGFESCERAGDAVVGGRQRCSWCCRSRFGRRRYRPWFTSVLVVVLEPVAVSVVVPGPEDLVPRLVGRGTVGHRSRECSIQERSVLQEFVSVSSDTRAGCRNRFSSVVNTNW